MFLTAALAGIVVGFLAGILPGINISFVMIVSMPFLIGMDTTSILIYYLAVMSSSQYSGSISALLYGIPGESTSLPAIKVRQSLDVSQYKQALYNCATGSIIGSLVALIISLPIFYLSKNHTFYLTTIFLILAGSVGILLSALTSKNNILESTLLILAGWTLSKIGYDQTTNANFLTFNNPYLMGGIPFISVTVALFVIPSFIQVYFNKTRNIKVGVQDNKINFLNKNTLIFPSLRASVVGYILGLIPYIGSVASSNIAYFVERKINKNNYMAQLTASETANNSAYFSVLIPLLLFGVAIIPSETILLESINLNGQLLNWQLVEKILPTLLLFFVAINFICWILSYFLADSLVKVLDLPKNFLIFLLLTTIGFSVWYAGQQFHQGYYYFLVLLILTPLGILLYKKDTMPLIFAFLLQPSLESAFIRVINLYG